ncbi:hypothetical protein [Luteitalea sp.]|jgi:hypothetical protein|uniref:hypothetical protein n=1 Tax=Luteitalea sp. TaxID=2004800 RepID=UPI0037C9932E
MTLDPRLLVSWCRDVLIAYAGGLVLGAPVALVAVWLTGRNDAATVSLLAAMAALLVALRRRRPAEAAPAFAVSPGQRRVA